MFLCVCVGPDKREQIKCKIDFMDVREFWMRVKSPFQMPFNFNIGEGYFFS